MAGKTVPVSIEYTSPGAQPPVYVAGDFTQWQPEEMQFTFKDGENHFYKNVQVEAGSRHQYKFRLGPGDWWVMNENAPTVTDDAGNRNNLLLVPTHSPESPDSKSDDAIAEQAQNSDVPVLVVEKVDDKPVHGEDMGENATRGQKDAYDKRAKDAEPDVVIVKDTSGDRDSAETASEVADSAAILDREASPAPISDAEAGRIGERRMSMTPIGDVSRVAAEVADSAQELDNDDKNQTRESALFEPQPVHHNHVDIDSEPDLEPDEDGASTPFDESELLLPHEQPGIFDAKEHQPATSVAGQGRKMSVYEQEPIINKDDPELEQFPTERDAILTRIRTAERRNSHDTPIEEGHGSPVLAKSSRSSSRAQMPQTPLLDMISEERNEPSGGMSLGGALLGDSDTDDDNAGPVLKSRKSTTEGANGPSTVIETLSSAAGPALGRAVDAVGPLTTKVQGLAVQASSSLASAAEAILPAAILPDVVKDAAGGVQSTRSADLDGSSDEYVPESQSSKQDTAATTALSSAENGTLKSRSSALKDQDRTEAPITVSGKDNDSPKSFLAMIWRTVFVGYVGGLFTRLCGGRRRP